MPDDLFTRAQARATGLTDRQIDRRLASGTWLAVRPGILRRVGGAVADDRIPLAVRAALLGNVGRDLVISHSTAARLFGLPKPLSGWPQPHFTATSGPTRRRSGIQIRVATLGAIEVVDRLGLPVTSVARTVADCLRTLPGRDGLAMVDAALHRGLVTEEALLTTLMHQTGWPGVARARQVSALAEGRRESPLESWSAWAFAHTGVPAPQWQVEVRDPDGHFLARADSWWPGVVGEADGRAKYALAAAEKGGDASAVYEVLHAERRREQLLRDVGTEIVRWSTGDVVKEAAAAHLARRIGGAISMAQDRAGFRGVVTPTMLQASTGCELDEAPRR
jgi:hypothetical protein